MSSSPTAPEPETREFYRRSLRGLIESGVPFLVGGAYALAKQAGVERHTKDLDVFLRPADRDRALEALEAGGCRIDVAFPHWLAKAYEGDGQGRRFIDVIYRSGNGLGEVDDEWFAHAPESEILGVPVRLTPLEESLWSKAFVMERERFDGADVAHILHARGRELDWDRLVRRFGPHWRVLLAHVVLYGFIYPSDRDRVPPAVVEELSRRLLAETVAPPEADAVCQGTLLSREQYLKDVGPLGFEDGRVAPRGLLTAEEVEAWTEAIGREEAH